MLLLCMGRKMDSQTLNISDNTHLWSSDTWHWTTIIMCGFTGYFVVDIQYYTVFHNIQHSKKKKKSLVVGSEITIPVNSTRLHITEDFLCKPLSCFMKTGRKWVSESQLCSAEMHASRWFLWIPNNFVVYISLFHQKQVWLRCGIVWTSMVIFILS